LKCLSKAFRLRKSMLRIHSWNRYPINCTYNWRGAAVVRQANSFLEKNQKVQAIRSSCMLTKKYFDRCFEPYRDSRSIKLMWFTSSSPAFISGHIVLLRLRYVGCLWPFKSLNMSQSIYTKIFLEHRTPHSDQNAWVKSHPLVYLTLVHFIKGRKYKEISCRSTAAFKVIDWIIITMLNIFNRDCIHITKCYNGINDKLNN